MTPTDPLWPHFSRIWPDLQTVDPSILLIGGYGLFLKQEWLLQQSNPTIVVPFERWGQPATPRVTKDMDLVIGLDVIAHKSRNQETLSVLRRHGFADSPGSAGLRWKFVKDLANVPLTLELHAEKPADQPNLSANDGHRVKHKPSLGDQGIHGRENREAVGSQLDPFQFEVDSITISVPNPVTWSIMKLMAANQTYHRYENESEEGERNFLLANAIKHASDVFRIIALLGPEEMSNSREVASAIKRHTIFTEVRTALKTSFIDGSWAMTRISRDWQPQDAELIHSTLERWWFK